MTAAQWRRRIENNYKAMCAFPFNPLFSWSVAPGETPPHVMSYDITYNVTTKVESGFALTDQNRTKVRITLPDSPNGAPSVTVIGGKIPFSPNIYPSGNFCLGDIWEKEPILWKLVIDVGRIIAFDPERTNPSSPANLVAAHDWIKKQSARKKPYPCGRTDFPRPIGY